MEIGLLPRTVLRFRTSDWLQDIFSAYMSTPMVLLVELNKQLGQMYKNYAYRLDRFFQNQDRESKMIIDFITWRY